MVRRVTTYYILLFLYCKHVIIPDKKTSEFNFLLTIAGNINNMYNVTVKTGGGGGVGRSASYDGKSQYKFF